MPWRLVSCFSKCGSVFKTRMTAAGKVSLKGQERSPSPAPEAAGEEGSVTANEPTPPFATCLTSIADPLCLGLDRERARAKANFRCSCEEVERKGKEGRGREGGREVSSRR